MYILRNNFLLKQIELKVIRKAKFILVLILFVSVKPQFFRDK